MGPSFIGDSSFELAAYDQPFNGDNKCYSCANAPGYKIPIEDGKNMLTNKKDGNFTITELEVWEVKFIVNYYIKLILYRTDRDQRHREKTP